METKRDLNNQIKDNKSTPFLSMTKSFFDIIEESLEKGEEIEFVSFSEWQKKHKLNIKVNQKEFRPLGY